MPRIKLKPLPQYSFSTTIKVRITDLNYGGHLGNDRILSLVHEARVEFLANYGFTELDCGGTSLILADTTIVYKGEAFAGEFLKFDIAAAESTSHGFRLFYRITRTPDSELIALVENGMVCFDYEKRSIQPLPDAVRKICLS